MTLKERVAMLRLTPEYEHHRENGRAIATARAVLRFDRLDGRVAAEMKSAEEFAAAKAAERAKAETEAKIQPEG
jgi:hypothetical protein